MKRKNQVRFASRCWALTVILAAAWTAQAQEIKTPYPSMAPIGQYLMARSAEITLARSAAPEAISSGAEVMVLGSHGYETAVKGRNGFVCLVERSWTAGIDDPDFWNQNIRAPICFNPAAARTYVPLTIRKTNSVLAARSKARMFADIKTAFDRKELPAIEPGAMCYMMSKQGYGGDSIKHWPSHIMFFYSHFDPANWGANLPGSPVLGMEDTVNHLTEFAIPVQHWSDGTPAR